MNARIIFVAACLAALSAASFAQEPPAGDAARGFKAYMHHLCYACHGTEGQGGERGAGPRIAPGVWQYAAFAQQTRKPRLVMIPYTEKTLPEQDLADIHAYLRTIKNSPLTKDVPLLKEF